MKTSLKLTFLSSSWVGTQTKFIRELLFVI
jgi:hypothetical protein